jgi:hypothetical protein
MEALGPGNTFDKYEVKEVTLTGDSIQVADDGTVTEYIDVDPVNELTIKATPKNGPKAEYTYVPTYSKGATEGGGNNVRTDTVTNLRHDGVVLRVRDWSGEDAVKGARAMGFCGFNLTIPHKVAVIPLLDELTEAARLIGAVNTVVRRDGKLIGENTDGKGFLKSLRDNGIDPAGKTVTLLGAGGAARAINIELALAGARKINIINRSEERGAELAAAVSERTNADASYIRWISQVRIPEETDIALIRIPQRLIDKYCKCCGKRDSKQDDLRIDFPVQNDPQYKKEHAHIGPLICVVFKFSDYYSLFFMQGQQKKRRH